jgi:cell division protein FtsB
MIYKLEIKALKKENEELKKTIQKLEEENKELKVKKTVKKV